MILLANQNNSPGQPKESLRVATAVRYNYYVQLVAIKARSDARTEFKILEHSLRGGWKLVVHKAVGVFQPKVDGQHWSCLKITEHVLGGPWLFHCSLLKCLRPLRPQVVLVPVVT